MSKYDELEHDSHENPTPAAAIPPGLAQATAAGEKPLKNGMMAKARELLKRGREELPWLRWDNEAIWEGDALDDGD